MGIREDYAQGVAEIRTARRDAEQGAQREIVSLRKDIEGIAEHLGRLDAEMEEALARIREEFRVRQEGLSQRRVAAETLITECEAKAQQARRESEEKLARRAVRAAQEAERTLTLTEAQVRTLAESRKRREQVLAANPEAARLFAEHEQIRAFLQATQGAGALPATALKAVLDALNVDLKHKESRLKTAGVPLDPVAPPPSAEILILFQVWDPPAGGAPEIAVLVPCLYSRFDEPALDAPPFALRIAAGIVRAVAEIQQAMCTTQVPVLYARADDMLLVRGPLTEHSNTRDTADMLESELPSAVKEIGKQMGTPVDPVALQLGPGVVESLLQSVLAAEGR